MDRGRRREGETYGKSNMESYMAIAKLCQSCPTLCNPIDSSPPGSALPGILQEHGSGLPFPSLESYITLCKINSQGEFAVCLRKLKQGLCINLEGWGGEGDGMVVQEGGGICTPIADSC